MAVAAAAIIAARARAIGPAAAPAALVYQ